nr:hypothetical protein CFP56_79537 [Quercus suber]
MWDVKVDLSDDRGWVHSLSREDKGVGKICVFPADEDLLGSRNGECQLGVLSMMEGGEKRELAYPSTEPSSDAYHSGNGGDKVLSIGGRSEDGRFCPRFKGPVGLRISRDT